MTRFRATGSGEAKKSGSAGELRKRSEGKKVRRKTTEKKLSEEIAPEKSINPSENDTGREQKIGNILSRENYSGVGFARLDRGMSKQTAGRSLGTNHTRQVSRGKREKRKRH